MLIPGYVQSTFAVMDDEPSHECALLIYLIGHTRPISTIRGDLNQLRQLAEDISAAGGFWEGDIWFPYHSVSKMMITNGDY